jgi:hypothetical protein
VAVVTSINKQAHASHARMPSVTCYQVSLCLVRLVITLQVARALFAQFVLQAPIVLLNLLVLPLKYRQPVQHIPLLTKRPLTMQSRVQLVTDAHQQLWLPMLSTTTAQLL